MQPEECQKCHYRYGVSDAILRLECHRNAPNPMPVDNKNLIGTEWPIVNPDDWCGEYKEA